MSNQHDEQERDPEDLLDRILRPELRWDAPAYLTANLLTLIPASPALLAALPSELAFGPRQRPKRWYVVLVTILTILAISVSLLVAWDIYGAVSAELGLPGLWQALSASVASGLDRVLAALPQLNMLVSLLAGIRNYLYWLLLVAVLWAALDGWSPSVPFRRQQPS